MKKVLIFLIALLSFNVYAKATIDISENNGNTTLLFVQAHYDNPNCYVDDPEGLRYISEQWRFSTPSWFYKCGYDYEGYKIVDGKATKILTISFDCNEIVIGKKAYKFTAADWEKITPYLKPVEQATFVFNSLYEARNKKAELEKEDAFLFMKNEDWFDYEGSFRFIVPHTEYKSNTEQKIKKLLESKYPHEKYKVYLKSYSSTDGYTFIIYSDFSFYKTFSDYRKTEWCPFVEFKIDAYLKIDK